MFKLYFESDAKFGQVLRIVGTSSRQLVGKNEFSPLAHQFFVNPEMYHVDVNLHFQLKLHE
jgi:hypothetical protein